MVNIFTEYAKFHLECPVKCVIDIENPSWECLTGSILYVARYSLPTTCKHKSRKMPVWLSREADYPHGHIFFKVAIVWSWVSFWSYLIWDEHCFEQPSPSFQLFVGGGGNPSLGMFHAICTLHVEHFIVTD